MLRIDWVLHCLNTLWHGLPMLCHTAFSTSTCCCAAAEQGPRQVNRTGEGGVQVVKEWVFEVLGDAVLLLSTAQLQVLVLCNNLNWQVLLCSC